MAEGGVGRLVAFLGHGVFGDDVALGHAVGAGNDIGFWRLFSNGEAVFDKPLSGPEDKVPTAKPHGGDFGGLGAGFGCRLPRFYR